jgi:hypothetical protein
LTDLFGLTLVPATIARMSAACAERLRSFADMVREHVAAARVKHFWTRPAFGSAGAACNAWCRCRRVLGPIGVFAVRPAIKPGGAQIWKPIDILAFVAQEDLGADIRADPVSTR